MDVLMVWLSAHFLEIAALAVLWIIARGIDRIEVSLKQSEHYLSLLVDNEPG
jgi:hypothetical protein